MAHSVQGSAGGADVHWSCAGSTGGGIKVSRILILGKTLGKELKQALHPQVVAPARMDGKLLNHETIRTTNVFMAAYSFIFVGPSCSSV